MSTLQGCSTVPWQHCRDSGGPGVGATIRAHDNKSFQRELFVTISTCMTLIEKNHLQNSLIRGSLIKERLTFPFSYSDHFFILVCPPVWNRQHFCAPQVFFSAHLSQENTLPVLLWHLKPHLCLHFGKQAIAFARSTVLERKTGFYRQ